MLGEWRGGPSERVGELVEGFRAAAVAAEVYAVAAAEGVELPPDLPDKALGLADSVDGNSYSSLHHDLVQGPRMELDGLLGEVLRRGERHGVDVPTTKAVHGVLEPWAARAERAGAR